MFEMFKALGDANIKRKYLEKADLGVALFLGSAFGFISIVASLLKLNSLGGLPSLVGQTQGGRTEASIMVSSKLTDLV